MNPLHIIVHREKTKDADQVFKEMLERLYITGIDISYDTRRKIIDIGNFMSFHFRSGDVDMMAGLRCDYFNADTEEVIEYLYTRCKYGLSSNIPDWDRYMNNLIYVLWKKEKGYE